MGQKQIKSNDTKMAICKANGIEYGMKSEPEEFPYRGHCWYVLLLSFRTQTVSCKWPSMSRRIWQNTKYRRTLKKHTHRYSDSNNAWFCWKLIGFIQLATQWMGEWVVVGGFWVVEFTSVARTRPRQFHFYRWQQLVAVR